MSSLALKRFVRTIEAALDRIGVRREATILVALSGGADSVALFHAMLTLSERFGYKVVAAHLNHRIRGDEADRDEAFVRDLCSRCGMELIVERADGLSFDTPNLEERAREARHAFLDAAADRIGADYIAVAHQADDQAETVLMRLLRGAGAAGLSAMAERGLGRIIRPMLHVTREEVLAYLKGIGEQFVSDSSNQSSVILRNRIRSELMPMLERDYAPGLRVRLFDLATELRALDDFVKAAARREIHARASNAGLDISRFDSLHPALQAELIRQYLEMAAGSLRRIERIHVESIRRLCLAGPPNGSVDVPGLRMTRAYTVLRAGFRSGEAAPFMVRLDEGRTEIFEAGFRFEMTTIPSQAATTPHNQFEALFDADAASAGLIVRSFRSGDRIAPLGMAGHRKVHDVLVDHKIPVGKRASFPIVELEGAIAWLPGIVRGRVALMTKGTECVLRIRASSAI